MILYFADRFLNILGNASTDLPSTITVTEDEMIEDVETGVASFECELRYDNKHNRLQIEDWATVGNYILCKDNDETKLFTIVESEKGTKKQSVYIYAEDDGMDLLNEVFGAYKADKEYTIDHYVNMFAAESGFEIGINEIPTLKKQLEWDDEATATKRIAETAALFDGAEISFSFEVDRLLVVKRYINIFQKRGKDENATLRLNFDIDNIITTQSITNLATALQVTGGTIEQDAEVLKKAKSSGSPVVAYSVELKTLSRTASTVELQATITSALTAEKAEFSKEYGLKASLYIGGGWHDAIIKATDEENGQKWTGTTNHSTEYTFTVSGISAGVVTFSDIRLKVARTDGGSAGVLSSTACEKFTVPNYIKGGENGEDINSRNITIEGYKYDDGDFYVDGKLLKSREAVQTWHRYFWKTEEDQEVGGHIVKLFKFDTFDQATLKEKAIEELKKLREIEVNYEIEIRKLPDDMKIGDRINVVDDEGNLYLSTRLLKIKKSNTNKEYIVTLGEHLIKSSGIHDKVAALAEDFAKNTAAATKALNVAKNATEAAKAAQTRADKALDETRDAVSSTSQAVDMAEIAQAAAEAAETAANNAQTAVDAVSETVNGMQTSITNAEAVAEQAKQAAQTAETKASEAQTAANNALNRAADVAQNLVQTQKAANDAVDKANTAQTTAEQAISDAEDAATTAAAAKLDAEQAQKDVESLGEGLTTLSEVMTAEYTRKTDLTETEASLKAEIKKNAAQISSTLSKVTIIDETANTAAAKAAAAYLGAEEAQAAAEEAQELAEQAQALADTARINAEAAQAEADVAQAAANTAQEVLKNKNSELQAAQADLEAVMSRLDATEAEIAQAQQAVDIAQAAADTAKTEAQIAVFNATTSQNLANEAAETAAQAQAEADKAANDATIAQMAAEQSSGSLASKAQETANTAKQTAENAQETASTAVANASIAQQNAETAANIAVQAQTAADEADEKAVAAQNELNIAKQNLAEVTSKVGATEEEIAAAQAAVNTAQQAADKATADALAAQNTANTAKANAQTAQAAADNAKQAADAAQAAANAAQQAADAAQSAVDSLSVRVVKTEADIIQTNEKIKLFATKEEMTTTLGGYYTKEETDAAISISENIALSVSNKLESMEIGGRNIVRDGDLSKESSFWTCPSYANISFANGYCEYYRTTTSGSRAFLNHSTDVNPLLCSDNLANGTFTLSAEIKLLDGYAITNGSNLIYRCNTSDLASGFQEINIPLGNATTEWQKVQKSLTFGDYTFGYCRVGVALADTANTGICIRNVKLERGLKATDWTPAPEDVDDDIISSSDEVRREVSESLSQVLLDAEGITLEHLKKYVSDDDLAAELAEYVGSQIKLLEDRITNKITGVENKANSVDEDLQNKYNLITKYFDFTIDGLEIKSVHTDENGVEVVSPYKIVIDNDNQTTYANGAKVQIIDAVTGEVLTPKLKVTEGFSLLGYQISKDETTGNVNWDYIGGE